MEVIEEKKQTDTDQAIVNIAKRRVKFKKHFMSYLIVSGILWCIWLFSGMGYPWPVWPMFGWGIAVVFDYMSAYKNSDLFSVEKEIEQIKKDIQNP